MLSVTMKEWTGSRFSENQSCSSSKNNRIDLLDTTLVPDNCPERSAVRPDIPTSPSPWNSSGCGCAVVHVHCPSVRLRLLRVPSLCAFPGQQPHLWAVAMSVAEESPHSPSHPFGLGDTEQQGLQGSLCPWLGLSAPVTWLGGSGDLVVAIFPLQSSGLPTLCLDCKASVVSEVQLSPLDFCSFSHHSLLPHTLTLLHILFHTHTQAHSYWASAHTDTATHTHIANIFTYTNTLTHIHAHLTHTHMYTFTLFFFNFLFFSSLHCEMGQGNFLSSLPVTIEYIPLIVCVMAAGCSLQPHHCDAVYYCICFQTPKSHLAFYLIFLRQEGSSVNTHTHTHTTFVS